MSTIMTRLRHAGHQGRRSPRTDDPPRPRARSPHPPPLQRDTTADMLRMYAEEDEILELKAGHATSGPARSCVPIDRAIEIVAKKGLPHRDAAPKIGGRPGVHATPSQGPRLPDDRTEQGTTMNPVEPRPRTPHRPSPAASPSAVRRRPGRACPILLAASALAVAAPVASAQPGGVLKDVAFDQNLNAQIPLTLPFRDEEGQAGPAVRLLRQAAGDPGPGLLKTARCSARRCSAS